MVGLDSYYGGYFSGCYIDYVYLSGYYADFSVFNPHALAIWYNDQQVASGSETLSDAVDIVKDAIADAIGVPVGGWPMEEVFGSNEDLSDPVFRGVMEGFLTILGIGRANADEIDPDEAPRQSLAEANCMFVSARPVKHLGLIAKHASLTYLLSQPYQTISATDNNPGSFPDGQLVSQKNNNDDDPYYTMFVALVFPPSGLPCDPVSDQPYWAQLLSADSNYGDNLTYDKNGTPGQGYNSNGYIHGILNATGGTVDPSQINIFTELIGWYNPVPPNVFQ